MGFMRKWQFFSERKASQFYRGCN